MSRHTIGVDVGQVNDPSALSVIEFYDDWGTLRRPLRDIQSAVRVVKDVRVLPLGISYQTVVEEVATVAASLGDGTSVVFDKTGSRGVADIFLAGYREHLFARRPRGVTIASEDASFSLDGDGDAVISNAELVRVLAEMVKRKAFTLDRRISDVESLISEAMSMEAVLSPTKRLRFASRRHDDRVFSLALALYPRLAPSHIGRRYRAPDGRFFETFGAADALIGQRARA